ncbi:MAG: glycosyltransferase family 2 protein [Hyphomonadaceae bacterium]|nr:glycosyltransferase family 2 protein [Hyphomonadaceae bacterium]
MTISAVTVSYQTGPVLRDCLDALIAAPEISEIVLVDNGNPPDVEAWLDQRAAAEPRLKLVRGQGNVGFGRACNAGAKRAAGDVLLFVNPDVVLAPGAAASMQEALAGVDGLALIGGDVRDADGQPDRGTRRERVTLWSAFVSFSGLSRLERVIPAFRDLHRHRDPLPSCAAECAHVSGALMLMRRTDFERLGGFDEAYFLHVEDIDLCWRVTQAGGRVLFQPGAIGVHARSSSAAASREVEAHKASGFERFFRKSARSPFERFMAGIVGGVLKIVLPARAPAR